MVRSKVAIEIFSASMNFFIRSLTVITSVLWCDVSFLRDFLSKIFGS